MKNNIGKFFMAIAVFALFLGCKKEAKLTYLDVITFPSGAVALTATTNKVVLSSQNRDSGVIAFNWPAVDYLIKHPVVYTMQLTSATDIAWSKYAELKIGDDVLGKFFTGAELNKLAIEVLALVPNVKAGLLVRIQAYLNKKVYSNSLTIDITPMAEEIKLKKMWVPGSHQGWDPAKASTISEMQLAKNVYDGYINVPQNTYYGFKLTPQASWQPIAYGDNPGTSGKIIVPTGGGNNMELPDGEGFYHIIADFNTNTWTGTKTVWGVIGDAVAGGGWNVDKEMTYDKANNVWTITLDMLAGKNFKFRTNKAWKVDLALNPQTQKLVYANHPKLQYNSSLINLSVASNGTYTIILDVSKSPDNSYKLIKN